MSTSVFTPDIVTDNGGLTIKQFSPTSIGVTAVYQKTTYEGLITPDGDMCEVFLSDTKAYRKIQAEDCYKVYRAFMRNKFVLDYVDGKLVLRLF